MDGIRSIFCTLDNSVAFSTDFSLLSLSFLLEKKKNQSSAKPYVSVISKVKHHYRLNFSTNILLPQQFF